jgi:chaperonin cofactor prefoldin
LLFLYFHSLKLNASLEALEEERNQIYTQLSEVDKTKEDLTGKVFLNKSFRKRTY